MQKRQLDVVWTVLVGFLKLPAATYYINILLNNERAPWLKIVPALLLALATLAEASDATSLTRRYSYGVTLFLFLSALGDLALAFDDPSNDWFVLGAMFFGLAHITLTNNFMTPLFGQAVYSQFYTVALVSLAFCYFVREVAKIRFYAFIGLYVFLLLRSVYCGWTRVGKYSHYTFATMLSRIGMCFFVFSDSLVGADIVGLKIFSDKWKPVIVISTYWIGICLVAYSVRDQWPRRDKMTIERQKKCTSWFGDHPSKPRVVVHPVSREDIITILKDTVNFPSPIRCIGSMHSVTNCVCTNGTLIDITRMNRIFSEKFHPSGDEALVFTEPGALYIDVAEFLETKGYQFFVNVELGNLTMGAAAVVGTKKSAFPDQFGQVSSYCERIVLITPSGEIQQFSKEIDEKEFSMVLSSYGLIGVVVEVAFRVKKILPMEVRYKILDIQQFKANWDTFKAEKTAKMFYFFPFKNKIVIESRNYGDELLLDRVYSRIGIEWKFRNYIWATVTPLFGYYVWKIFSHDTASKIIDFYDSIMLLVLNSGFLSTRFSNPTDQQIRYPAISNNSRYTFTFWAFPGDNYPEKVEKFFEFCTKYYKDTNYRCNIVNVGYWISKDESNHFSYSFDGFVGTLDPVSTAQPGWEKFLQEYNEWSVTNNGRPLFNQTDMLDKSIVRKCFGDAKVMEFTNWVKQRDPTGRMMTPFFQEILY